ECRTTCEWAFAAARWDLAFHFETEALFAGLACPLACGPTTALAAGFAGACAGAVVPVSAAPAALGTTETEFPAVAAAPCCISSTTCRSYRISTDDSVGYCV